MSKAPATQFYWKDWTSDIDLRRCSLAAQGAWLHVLALMHTAPEYGVLRWPLKEIASTAGVPLKFLRELASKNVLKGDDKFDAQFVHVPRHAGKSLEPVTLVVGNGGPCWYSARFVRDEWARGRRGIGSRFTPDNQPERSPNGRMGERLGDGPASAFASASADGLTDTYQREETIPGGAPDLARALRENGYSECSAHVPELIEAQAAGVTVQELTAVAVANKGKRKSIAYLVATAIGKRNDRAEREQGRNGNAIAAPAIDPTEAKRRDELHKLDDEKLTAESDHRLGIIDASALAERLAGLQARRQQLMGARS